MQQSIGFLLIGMILPPIIALAKPKLQSKMANYLFSLFISVIGALIALLFNGDLKPESFSLDQVFTTLGLIVLASQTAYNVLWKPTGTTDKIEQMK